MVPKLDRRQFVAGAAAGLAAAAPGSAFGRAPAVRTSRTVSPVVIASGNGHRYTNGGTRTCVETAFRLMTSGTDVLDALIAGVNIVELDPEDASVGYGGRPNADGVVQLDACCMHGPETAGRRGRGARGRAHTVQRGAEGRRPDRSSPAGRAGAQRFARQLGFAIEDDLNTDRSRRMWLEWKRRTDPGHYLDPDRTAAGGDAAARGRDVDNAMLADGVITGGGAVRHHQLQRHQCGGRDLRRHDDERTGLEDPGSGG